MSYDCITDAFRAHARAEAADPMPGRQCPGYMDWWFRSNERYHRCMEVVKVAQALEQMQAAIDDAEVARLCEAEVFPEG